MIFTQIWERYFIKEFTKVFFFFLFCFYGLYVLIDYASHTSALPHHHVQIRGFELARYYLFIFASRAEILIPIALLIALCKTLISLNVHGELVALMASGFKLKKLLRPFLIFATAAMILLFLNEQFLLPSALKKLRRIEDSTKHQRSRNTPNMTAHHMILQDGSIFLYQSYDTAKDQFFDAYWIQTIDSIYRIKYLSPNDPHPIGYFVDHLTRQPNQELALKESLEQYAFHNIQFSSEILHSSIVDPDALSLTELWAELPFQTDELSEKESKAWTAFYWKLMMPWLCLLAIMAPAPFCVKFSRQFPMFFIYICGIFGIIAFYLLMDASQIIAKRQVLTPLLAIGVPFMSIFGFFWWRYSKL